MSMCMFVPFGGMAGVRRWRYICVEAGMMQQRLQVLEGVHVQDSELQYTSSVGIHTLHSSDKMGQTRFHAEHDNHESTTNRVLRAQK